MEKFQALTWSHILGAEQSLGVKRLFEHLDAQLQPKYLQATINLLAKAAIQLHKRLTEKNMSLYDADLELLTTGDYGQGLLLHRILELKKQNNLLVLFNKKAFQFIYHLSIYEVDYSADSQDSDLPAIDQYKLGTPLGMVLLANELFFNLKKEKHFTPEESAEIRDFYSRCLVDPAGAIGRSGLLYDQPYFNKELQERIGASVQDVRCIAFTHFVHIMTKDPAVFDLASSFKLSDEMRPALRAVSQALSLQHKSEKIKFSDFIDQLDLDLALGKKIRGKPLLEANGLYYCLCPELLGSPLSDLPYHLIWTDMRQKEEKAKPLHDARGEAFHEYIIALSKTVLGGICRQVHTKKDGEFGDFLIDLMPEEKLMVEWKDADPPDSAKGGNIGEVVRRFLLPPTRKGSGNRKNPGPLQVMDAALDYRKKYDFKGTIYTAVGFYGWFPEEEIFDHVYSQSIKNTDTCLEYEKGEKNIPTMLWNAFTWELMLSAVKQKASSGKSPAAVLHSMLEELKAYIDQPSRSSMVIEEYFQKNGLKFSVAPIFTDEIQRLAEICKSKIKAPQINI